MHHLGLMVDELAEAVDPPSEEALNFVKQLMHQECQLSTLKHAWLLCRCMCAQCPVVGMSV